MILTALAGMAMAASWPSPLRAVGDATPKLTARVVYLSKAYADPLPLSLLEDVAADQGLAGARYGHQQTVGTGRFLGHRHELVEAVVGQQQDVVAKAAELLAAGERVIIADLIADDLLAVADLPGASDAIILNVRAPDDRLRQRDCRRNVFHIAPSFAMRTDALAQYLAWKGWRRALLVTGSAPSDAPFVAALQRAYSRFGLKIVETRNYAFKAGSRRMDTGHQQIQAQMPLVTQGAPPHDVVLVADTGEVFGEYLPFRTAEPKPVVGTHGLVATTWHRAFEQFGAKTMQQRFEDFAKRKMTERDHLVWLGVRTMGEAVLRSGTSDVAALRAFMLSDAYVVAGFKGTGLTFRTWNRQMRQPLLIMGPRALVSISPQEGYLHPKFVTDTLGFDEAETACGQPG
ncbi:MAG: ABC transporter substrate-binding protein [Hyphomicrobiaceae bacterium]|nr:ABC transporter substrate-binding protein [Hyphomicrobiaceae bacterium]